MACSSIDIAPDGSLTYNKGRPIIVVDEHRVFEFNTTVEDALCPKQLLTTTTIHK